MRSLSKTFRSRADALAWARKADRDADLGELPERRENRDTLADLLRRYLVEVTPTKKGHAAETRKLSRLFKDELSKVRLIDLRPDQLATFRQRRLKAGRGAARHDLILIRHAISIGMKEWGLQLRFNPCAAVRMPPPSKVRTRRLSAVDYQKVIDTAEKSRLHWMRPLIEIATETAMRRSELLRLKWSDINYDSSLAKLEDTKNGEEREVPLSGRALQVLASLPRHHERVFPITDNSVRLAWPRLVKRAGLEDFHFHDLRHEAVSRLFERGLSVPEVALVSGHKTVSQLMRYTNLRPSQVVLKLAAARV